MAMYRYGYATVVEPSIAPEAWQESVCCGHKGSCSCGTKSCRVKVAKTILAKYSPEKWLLSHVSIMAAVETELANPKDPNSDWLIHPAFSQFVNNNGDAWSKKMLAASYKTFIGANNYQEHIQIPELSKGKVIDAALREVPVGKDASGKDLTTYYVDILVATERKHKDLIAKIESGAINSMSMGCRIQFSQCSKCGKKAVDETQACAHVRYEKNSTFIDDFGVTRKVAELCGRFDEPESVVFIDASWVANPAFTGAVRRNTVAPSSEILAKIEQAHGVKPFEMQEADYLKVAAKGDEPETPEDAPAEGTTEGDAPADPGAVPEAPAGDAGDTAAPTDATPADAPIGDEPPAAPEEPPPDPDDIPTWKTRIKKKLLDELGDEIMEEFIDDLSMGGGGPRELETLDDNMIRPTASRMLKSTWRMKTSWEKYLNRVAGHLDKKNFDRLKYGTYMLLTSSDLTALKDYGYNRRDFLAIMSFLDNCFKTPLAGDVRKALIKVGSTADRQAVDVLKDLSWWAGRELTAGESAKSLAWLKLMDAYAE